MHIYLLDPLWCRSGIKTIGLELLGTAQPCYGGSSWGWALLDPNGERCPAPLTV